jgi:TatD DNase family protein
VIDTHCHIDQFSSPEEVARSTEKEAIFTIAVTNLPTHYKLACEHLIDFRYVKPALGMHPLAAKEHAQAMAAFRNLILHSSFVGEVGLDFSTHGRPTADQQMVTFDEVIRLAVRPFRIVTLHSRGAEDEVLRMLEAHHAGPVIFHWFSGSKAILKKVFSAGHYISLNPAMIRTKRWHEWISELPPERVLTETDGPFARFDGRVARPCDVNCVLEWLSAQWGHRREESERIVNTNFDRLLELLDTTHFTRSGQGRAVN